MDAILFDLDGTLLPLEQDAFIAAYFSLMSKVLTARGYEEKAVISALIAGVKAMLGNDGSQVNEERFWAVFSSMLGEKVLREKPVLDAFYRGEFESLRAICGQSREAIATVKALKEAGYRIALATSPVFPLVGVEARIRWAGLQPSDFEYITSYENTRTAKPNPAYYYEVTDRLGVAPERCLMVGNDVLDDMSAKETGMQVFLLTDCLLNREGKDISPYPQGSWKELRAFLGLEKS